MRVSDRNEKRLNNNLVQRHMKARFRTARVRLIPSPTAHEKSPGRKDTESPHGSLEEKAARGYGRQHTYTHAGANKFNCHR